jgi:radical S-adenosyl methionine domain-containing protein 2
MEPIFETASFHIVKPCNMKCKFCYATFDDMHVINQLPKKDAFAILDKLKEAGLEKITFAGGEPMLYKWIKEVVQYSKSIGLTTSIISNGSFFTNENLVEWVGSLDWIGISIDSLDIDVCQRIGRTNGKEIDYLWLCMRIKQLGFKLKINTVVNAYNVHDDMNSFISEVSPERWKVFQALRVDGQNDQQFDSIKVSGREYVNYVERHASQSCLVAENNEAMTGSYLLIDPQGRLFENSEGKHTYSAPLQDNEIETCLSEINLNREMFIKRGGIYEW